MTLIPQRLRDMTMCRAIFAPIILGGFFAGCEETQSGAPPAEQVTITSLHDGGLGVDGSSANPPTDCAAAAAVGLYGKTILCVPAFTMIVNAGWRTDSHNNFPTCWTNPAGSLHMDIAAGFANGHCSIESPNLNLEKYGTITVAMTYKTSGFSLAFNGARITAYLGGDPFIPVAPLVNLADSTSDTTVIFSVPRKLISAQFPVLVLSYDIASGPMMMSEVTWTVESLAVLGSNP